MKQVHFKRIISMLITVAMIVTMVPATFAATAGDFVDFPTGWSQKAMTFSVDNDLLRGKSGNRIEPAANLTRAEMATIINRAFGAKITKDISSYIDVKPTDWFYTELQKAVNMQTFRGDGNGQLRPNDAITREEVMAVVARAMVLEQSDYSPIQCFGDNASVSEWAKPYVAALVAGGYVNGCDKGYLNPKKSITREEFAQLMYNIFKTYHTLAGTYNTVTPQNCVMLNQPGITLKDVTVYGDLVLGDGVGEGIVNITNVAVKGRLLARGGNITLTNVTVDGGVVVKNVNGTTHFNNYKSEAVFNGVIEHTYTTYKSYVVSPGSSTGSSVGGGGGGSSSSKSYNYTINYYYQNAEDFKNGIIRYELLESVKGTVKSGTEITIEPKHVKNGITYVFHEGAVSDSEKSTVDSLPATVKITSNISHAVYYDLQTVKVVNPDGNPQTVVIKNDKTIRESISEAGLGEKEIEIGTNKYDVKWYVVDSQGNRTLVTDDGEFDWTDIIPNGSHLEYEMYATVTVDYNDGGVTASKTYQFSTKADGTYSIPAEYLADPTRTNYKFDGWFDKSNNKYTAETKISVSPLEINAHWTYVGSGPEPEVPAKVTIIFGNGQENDVSDLNVGDVVHKPADPTRDGYKFKGWYTAAEGGEEIKFPYTLTNSDTDFKIYAQWLKLVNVTFVYGNGDTDSTKEYVEGEAIGKPADPVYAEHTFGGWYTAETGGVEFVFPYVVKATDNDFSIYARWDQFYNVNFYYFNDNLELDKLDYVAKINVANEDNDRDLAYLNKTLDGIYNGLQLDPIVYNRTDLQHPNFDVEYEHSVEYEYIYQEEPGIWSVFTEDTVVNSDIDVYYASKLAALTFINVPGLPESYNTIPVEIRYDSQSRLADSVKDTLIVLGATLDNDIVKPEIESKVGELYAQLYDRTGMIDTNGNILDKDYGMKIIDVIDYDQIQAEVKLHIENMLNGTPEDLETVIGLIDIATLVDEIGGRELINAIGIDSLRAMLKEEAYKTKIIGYIQDKIKNDPSVIEMVLNSDAKDSLIEKAAGNDKFVVALLDNATFKSEILSILKTEKKTQLLEYLAKDALRNELISIIKDDKDFKALIADDTFIADITENVKTSEAFKGILTGNGAYKQNIVSQIKDEKLEELVTILMSNSQFKKDMVDKVAGAGLYDDQKSELQLKTKEAIMHIINTDENYAQYRTAMAQEYVYEAVVQFYVEGKQSFPGIRIQASMFKNTYNPMIDKVIEQVINSYFAYDPNDLTSAKPDGYDVMKSYFDAEIDGVIDDVIQSYVDGDYDSATEGASDYEIKKFIDGELAAHIKKALNDYVDAAVASDAEVEELIDDTLIGFVEDYINGVTLDADIVEIIESNIISFIKDYFSGNSSLADDEEISSLADGIKTEFVKKVKTADVDKIKQPIIEFVTDSANADFVNGFVGDNYIAIVDAVDDTFISNYINSMTDKELNDLVKEYADTEMIVNHIINLSAEERKSLANKIVSFLDSYTPYVEFMDAFKNKRDTFYVNKDNIHFVTAVGKAIYGFDFEEILEILKGKGFEPVINFVGEDVVEDIFNASKENYWKGLEPIVDLVAADGVTRQYTTKMNITINVPLLLESMYDNNASKFIDKVEANEIYDYDKNTELKKFVNIDWFNLFIGYDATRVDEENGVTGYYIRDYMDYYTAVLDTLIIFDNALCFYNSNDYTDEEFTEVKKSLTKDVITFLKELESLSDRIENGQPIYGGYTLKNLIDKVESLNDVVASMGGSVAGQEDNIKTVVDNVKSILVNLGEGDLPAGYTLDDLNVLSNKLVALIEGMNEGEYESINENFNDVISKALNKLDTILDELDKDGTIAGRPIDSIFSKISVLNTIYSKFASQLKSVVSILADVDFGSLDIEADAEKYVDIMFGREEDDIFNIDSIVDLVKERFNNEASVGGYYDEDNGYYVIDEYSKEVNEYGISFQRRFN